MSEDIVFRVSPAIRREIAEAAVRQAHPGWPDYGEYYAVDTDGDRVLDTVMYWEHRAPWNPWHDRAFAVGVVRLFDEGIDLWDEDMTDEDIEDAVSFAEGEVLEKWVLPW